MRRLLYLLPLFLSCLTSPVVAAVVCGDAQQLLTTTGTDPRTISYTAPSNANQVLVVGAVRRGSGITISSVTYAGSALTQEVTTASTDIIADFWWRVAPATGANDVVIDYSSTPLTEAIVIFTCSGVNQADPTRSSNSATGSGTAITVTVSDASGDVTVDMAGHDGDSVDFTMGADQSLFFKGSLLAEIAFGSSQQPGGSGGVMSWTAGATNDWSIVGMALQPVATSSRSRQPIVLGE